eukprot:11559417-Alexandrium_andersonii.AAC.1
MWCMRPYFLKANTCTLSTRAPTRGEHLRVKSALSRCKQLQAALGSFKQLQVCFLHFFSGRLPPPDPPKKHLRRNGAG